MSAPRQRRSSRTERDCLRNEGRRAGRQRGAGMKLPVPGKFRWRGRGNIAPDGVRGPNRHQRARDESQGLGDKRWRVERDVLREVSRGGEDTAGFVAVAWTGNRRRTLFRATIAFCDQAGGFQPTQESGWQPQEQQQRCDHWFHWLHVKCITLRGARFNPQDDASRGWASWYYSISLRPWPQSGRGLQPASSSIGLRALKRRKRCAAPASNQCGHRFCFSTPALMSFGNRCSVPERLRENSPAFQRRV